MIKKGISVKKCNNKKQVLYGILIGNSHVSGFLSWDLVKFAKLGRYLVSVHVLSPVSGMTIKDHAPKRILAIKDHSGFRRDFSTVKKVPHKGSASKASSIKKVLKRLARDCADMAVVLETNQKNTLGRWISCVRCCVDWLPGSTFILISTRSSILQLKGFRLNSRSEFCLDKNSINLRYGKELVVGNMSESDSEAILISEDTWRDGSEESNGHSFSLKDEFEGKVCPTSIPLIRKELPESTLGWPFLQRTISLRHGVLSRRPRTRNKSVVEWVMTLPSRKKISLDWSETNTRPDREIDDFSVHEGRHYMEGNTPRRIQAAKEESTDDKQNLEGENMSLIVSRNTTGIVSSSSLASLTRMLSQSKLGWPLRRITIPQTQESSRESEERKSPMVRQTAPENSSLRELCCSKDKDCENQLSSSMELEKESHLFLKFLSSNCKQFTYAELERATCQFSSENLIGEGGCSNVYKGCLSSGKLVAVKVLKAYKAAWSDFCLEVDITISLKHKNITPLVGVCMEHNILVLIYEFLPKGNLDEVLHGQVMEHVLPWEVRFNVAIAVAEALNYLHNECSRPVIHRDVKSSNILLSNELEPQLSDFGLAIWGPTDSTYMIHEDVAGTFGYIAPEYFTRGRLSDKIDVYSYGVVLLELLSARKPIASKNLEGQESLIKWAKPLLKAGDMEALRDPNLVEDFDSIKMQRMVLVANLCINQPAPLRPKADQILRLLRGEDAGNEWVDSQDYDVKGSCNQDDEDLLELESKPRLDFSFLDTDVDDVDTISLGNKEQTQRLKLKDYLKQQQD